MTRDDVVRWAWHGRGLGARVLRAVLLPLEGLFRLAVRIRTGVWDRRTKTDSSRAVGGPVPSAETASRTTRGPLRAPLPVISVGNLTVGGTGKTPLAGWIARTLADLGARPALLSRGHGEDELALHRRWNPDVPVVVDRRRIEGARTAAEQGATVAIVDDGFQHRALARDLDIVLLAAEQPFPGALLPRGPYREPPSALGRADLIVITRKTAGPERAGAVRRRLLNLHPNVPTARALLAPDGWVDLSGNPVAAPSGDLLAVASVADPGTFRSLVERETGGTCELAAYPDHHAYTDEDARAVRRRANGRTVVTTEKDAVKLEAHRALMDDVRVLRLAVLLERGEGELRRALARFAGGEGPAPASGGGS